MSVWLNLDKMFEKIHKLIIQDHKFHFLFVFNKKQKKKTKVIFDIIYDIKIENEILFPFYTYYYAQAMIVPCMGNIYKWNVIDSVYGNRVEGQTKAVSFFLLRDSKRKLISPHMQGIPRGGYLLKSSQTNFSMAYVAQ